jgi:2'-hydroxyisoflavone reductase
MGICAEAAGTAPNHTYVSDEFLGEQGLTGADLPFWVSAEYENIFAVSVARAVAAGLRFRPGVETARDTLAWRDTRDVSALKVGLKPEREAELLKMWHERA